ncbi:MAG: YaeQ family protein [Ghiorsea sp.]|nr:YaeQ family protein [Ghiorsea sp.]
MAIKSTIYKADVQVSNMDTYYFEEHDLMLARHPSENEGRMMIRLLAFALNAHEYMAFTKGLCADDEPDLWQKSLSDEIEVWIDLGQPDEKRIRKACGRAKQVIIYTYNYRSALTWWEQVQSKLSRFDNLKVVVLADEAVSAMTSMAKRNMQLQYTIQDGEILLSNGEDSINIEPQLLTA